MWGLIGWRPAVLPGGPVITLVHVYLDVGGTGTVTATVNGKPTQYRVSGAPDIYTLVHQPSQERAVIEVQLSPGLSAYSFTFG
jgi:hypothetical protein